MTRMNLSTIFHLEIMISILRAHRPVSGLFALAAALLVALCAAFPAQAQTGDLTVRWELVRFDDQALAVLWVTPGPEYHFYANDPGGVGKPTVLIMTEVPGDQAVVVYVPGITKPDAFLPDIMVNVYESETPIFVLLGPVGGDVTVEGDLELLLCSDTRCLPAKEHLVRTWPGVVQAELPAARAQAWWPEYAAILDDAAGQGSGSGEVQEDQGGQDAAQDETQGAGQDASWTPENLAPRYFQPGLEVRSLGKAVLFAFIAGLILNFMPCVLPVISLKLSSLVAATRLEVGQGRRRTFRSQNLAFSLGILTFFLGLSVVLLSLGAAGMAWGRLFQEPALVLAMTVLVFVLGLSLFGVFDLPVVDFKAGRASPHSQANAFFTGLLATLLATPCSGPFLGGVLVWALQQPPLTLALVFACIGLGMASPYLVMAVFTDLVRIFPKPGAWTVYLQRFVGFFLMATTLYLLSILPRENIFPVLLLLLAAAFAAWMWGGWTNLSQSRVKRWTIRLAAVGVFAAAAFLLHQGPPKEVRWQAYEPAAFRQTLASSHVLVDFTADWCPTCKLLEGTALAESNLEEWAEIYGLAYFRADMTRDNPDAEALLSALGSSSIPVVAIFRAGRPSEPLVLRDLFTPGQLREALRQELE